MDGRHRIHYYFSRTASPMPPPYHPGSVLTTSVPAIPGRGDISRGRVWPYCAPDWNRDWENISPPPRYLFYHYSVRRSWFFLLRPCCPSPTLRSVADRFVRVISRPTRRRRVRLARPTGYACNGRSRDRRRAPLYAHGTVGRRADRPVAALVDRWPVVRDQARPRWLTTGRKPRAWDRRRHDVICVVRSGWWPRMSPKKAGVRLPRRRWVVFLSFMFSMLLFEVVSEHTR